MMIADRDNKRVEKVGIIFQPVKRFVYAENRDFAAFRYSRADGQVEKKIIYAP